MFNLAIDYPAPSGLYSLMIDTWRFIDTGSAPAAYNMSLDEAIAAAVCRDNALPTLRIYGWADPSVSIGCFQRIRDIDVDYCYKKNIPVVRRPTGGRAIFHDDEITYSFSVKTTSGFFSKGLLDSYRKISAALGLALAKTGLSPELKLMRETNHHLSAPDRSRNPFCFRSISFGEISINGKKIVGSAQKRWPGGLLQQGSIPFLLDNEKIAKIFKLDPLREIGGCSMGLKDMDTELDYGKLKDALQTSFEETFETKFVLSPPSTDEIALARELEARKYLSDEWTFRR